VFEAERIGMSDRNIITAAYHPAGVTTFAGCPECARLRRENAELHRRLAEAERRLVLARSQPEPPEEKLR
jgi:hypothetical protein